MIHQGDCLIEMKKLEVETFDAIVTDPPYGIDYQSAWRTDKELHKPKIANDGKPFIWWLHDAYKLMKSPGALICFCRWDVQDVFKIAIETAGFEIKSQVIWDRQSHGMGDLEGAFAPQHDVIWFATKGNFKFAGERPKSILYSMRLSGLDLSHPNEKPVNLMRQLIKPLFEKGHVLDPFCGSGSTGVACRDLGLEFTGIEIDPIYVELANRKITGIDPHSDQVSFDDILWEKTRFKDSDQESKETK